MNVLAVIGALVGLLLYAAMTDATTASFIGIRVWIAMTLVEAGVAATLGGLLGIGLGYSLISKPSGFADVLRMESRARRRGRKSRPSRSACLIEVPL